MCGAARRRVHEIARSPSFPAAAASPPSGITRAKKLAVHRSSSSIGGALTEVHHLHDRGSGGRSAAGMGGVTAITSWSLVDGMATEPPLGVIGAVGLPLSGLRMGHDINNARHMTERRDHVGFDRGDSDAQRPSDLGVVHRLNPVEQEHLSRPTRKAHDRIGVDVQRVARIEGSSRPRHQYRGRHRCALSSSHQAPELRVRGSVLSTPRSISNRWDGSFRRRIQTF